MKRYCIGNLTVDIEANCERLNRLGAAYECNTPGNADITVILKEETLDTLCLKYTALSRDEVAYMATGSLFYKKLTLFDGLMLHSSAIMMNNKAYMFSAPSGTGKSTHTALWKKVFKEKVTIINDDKPIIRKIKNEYMVFGTPWSGKTDLNNNVSAPLKAIVFLARASKNEIKKLNPSTDEIAPMFLEQTVRSKIPERTFSMLQTADDIIKNTGIYLLNCNISEDAVYTAYNMISKN